MHNVDGSGPETQKALAEGLKTSAALAMAALLATTSPIRTQLGQIFGGEQPENIPGNEFATMAPPAQTPPQQPQPTDQPVPPLTAVRENERSQKAREDAQSPRTRRISPRRESTTTPKLASQRQGVRSKGPFFWGL